MPPKKESSPPPEQLLGRPSNTLKMGIVGLPNVGKSTLFNVLTKLNVPAENYPFCTIEPSTARVPVPDSRYNVLVEHFKPASAVQAALSVTDIAGLVKGASQGEGLGNAFLSHIRAVDGIYHVVRIFEDVEVTHVEGAVDPVRDLDIIRAELLAKDEEMVKKAAAAIEKLAVRGNDKAKREEYDFLTRVATLLEEKREVRHCEWTAKEVDILNELQLITAKPVVYLINMSPADYISKKNRWLGKIVAWVEAHKMSDKSKTDPIIPVCASLEAEAIAFEDAAAAKAFWAEKGTTTTIPKVVRTGYHALHLVHFFTCGTDEVKCWTIRSGTKAPDAAGTIHTDFRDGFVKAEVYAFDDFKELGSEAEVKSHGKYRTEGKAYVVRDGDVIFFKCNTAGLAKKPAAGAASGKK